MTITLFEDDLATQLYPVSLSRATFAISCGSYRLIDLVAALGHPLRWMARPHLRETLNDDFGSYRKEDAPEHDQGALLINAALVPSVASREALRSILCAGKPGIVQVGKRVAAAMLSEGISPPS